MLRSAESQINQYWQRVQDRSVADVLGLIMTALCGNSGFLGDETFKALAPAPVPAQALPKLPLGKDTELVSSLPFYWGL